MMQRIQILAKIIIQAVSTPNICYLQDDDDDAYHGSSISYKLSADPHDFQRIWANYESLNKESERVKTFKEWPVSFLRPEDMARAGFAYLKQDDNVQCVYCYKTVFGWEASDVPLFEHKKHNPQCAFIRGESCGNVSIEDELRGMASKPLKTSQIINEYDYINSPSLNFETERQPAPEAWLRRGNTDNSFQQHLEAANQAPDHPLYIARETRRKSYKNWPSDTFQDIERLVDAGFFYTGLTDRVKCFQCGVIIKNWESNDDPWELHARWFPNCRYIKLHKKVLEITWEKVGKPLDVQTGNSGYQFPDAESLAKAVVESTDVHPQNDVTNGASDSEVLSEIAESFTFKNMKNIASRPSPVLNGSKTSNRYANERLCKVCMDTEMNIALIPCRHFVVCVDCVFRIDKCPICRAVIKGNVRLFWN
ncbi:Baculoviral IAP repeat containing [Chamberlinius hualienensis]